MSFYTGVGSRKTPPEYCHVMRELARWLSGRGIRLRSGHATGADQAFESGANGNADVFLPWRNYNFDVPVVGTAYPKPTAYALEIAARHHPAWHHLSLPGRQLHGRNTHAVLGLHCRPDDASHFLVCWTPEAEPVGGTGQAIRVAEAYGVPVFNLARPGMIAEVTSFVVLRVSE